MNLLLASVSPLMIDAIAIIFVLVFAIVGFVKGFTKLFFKVFGTILSLLFAILLCATVTQFLETQFSLVTNLAGELEGALNSIFGEELMNTTIEQAMNDGLSDLGIGGLLLPIVSTFAEDISIPVDTTLNQIICPTFSYYIVVIGAVIVLFILFKLIFWLISAIVKSLYALNIVALTDRVLGLALGALSGLLYLELAIMVLGIIPLGFIQEIYATISTTTFTLFVHNIGLYKLILDAIAEADIIGFVKEIILNNNIIK